MKRQYLIFVVSCVLCLFGSCSNEIDLQKNQQERNENAVYLNDEEIEMTDFEKLQVQTGDFNTIFFETMHPDLPSIPVDGRGFFNWLWFVVKCDAGGAVLGFWIHPTPGGALAGAILGSLGGIVAAPDYCAVDEIINSDDYYDNGSEMGRMHNEIIREIFSENDLCVYEHTIYDLSQIVAEKIEFHGYDSSPVYDLESETEFIEYFEIIVAEEEYFLNNPYALWDYVSEKNSECEDEMSYLSNYMYYADGIMETSVLSEYTDYLTDIVRESDVSESSKTKIIDVMSVYVNSRMLWYHENWQEL